LLLGYKPVRHVTVLNTVGNCNTLVDILYYIILYYIILYYIILYYIILYHMSYISYNIISYILCHIIFLWDHRCICGPSLTETSLCGEYLYNKKRVTNSELRTCLDTIFTLFQLLSRWVLKEDETSLLSYRWHILLCRPIYSFSSCALTKSVV